MKKKNHIHYFSRHWVGNAGCFQFDSQLNVYGACRKLNSRRWGRFDFQLPEYPQGLKYHLWLVVVVEGSSEFEASCQGFVVHTNLFRFPLFKQLWTFQSFVCVCSENDSWCLLYLTLQLWRRTKPDVAAAQASIGVTGRAPPSAIHVLIIYSLNVLAFNLSAAGDQMRRCNRMQETVLTQGGKNTKNSTYQHQWFAI